MAKKRLTPNQLAWEKEVRRLERFIKRKRREGYDIDESIIPDKPQRISKKALHNIANQKGDKLYQDFTYTNPATGVKQDAYKQVKQRRSQSARKGAETRRLNELVQRQRIMTRPTGEWEELGLYLEAELPEVRYGVRNGFVEISEEKAIIMNAYYQTTAELEDNMDILDDYVRRHESEFSSCLHVINMASNSTEIIDNLHQLARLVKLGQSLTRNEAISLESDTDYGLE